MHVCIFTCTYATELCSCVAHFMQAPLQLVISIFDRDTFIDDHVDSISISFPPTINVTTEFNPPMSTTGMCLRSTLKLQYRISSNCPQHRYGANCELACIPQTNKYWCNYLGERVCVGRFTGSLCDDCIDNYYGEDCSIKCIPPTRNHTCLSDGSVSCKSNFVRPNCTSCIQDYYGTTCSIFCEPREGRYMCNSDGSRMCLGNFGGSTCMRCKDNFYGDECTTFCIPPDTSKICNNNGMLEDLRKLLLVYTGVLNVYHI